MTEVQIWALYDIKAQMCMQYFMGQDIRQLKAVLYETMEKKDTLLWTNAEDFIVYDIGRIEGTRVIEKEPESRIKLIEIKGEILNYAEKEQSTDTTEG